MKATKILLAVSVACSLGTAGVLAQGRINFNNSSATPWRIIGFGADEVLGTASTAHFGIGPASAWVQLYAGLTSSSLSPVLIGSGANQLYVTNTASTLASAQGTFNGGFNLPLQGFDGSAPVFLQMFAQSFDGSYFGFSPIIQVIPAVGVATATPVFSTTADASHWNGLRIVDLPEPSALALVGMSFSMMFLTRRRK